MSSSPRLLQTYLIDGTLEGIRIIDCESSIEAYVIPRLKLAEARSIKELEQPALYILLNADDNQAYIGESENFLSRAGQHIKSKEWWTLAVAIVSKANDLEKGDVKYLESLAVERARSGSTNLQNSTIPPRNNIHRFKLHKLQKILDDAQLVLTSLGYDVLSSPKQETEQIWYLKTRKAYASGVYRGDQFVVLAGSTYALDYSAKWAQAFPKIDAMRTEIVKTKSEISDNVATLKENAAFRSVSLAAGFVTGSFANGWQLWKNVSGQTMDEVMRAGDK